MEPLLGALRWCWGLSAGSANGLCGGLPAGAGRGQGVGRGQEAVSEKVAAFLSATSVLPWETEW